jgi:hypothetical protein
MDDFGTQNATLWAQEKLFQILNYRYVNRLATVVTTNQDLAQIERASACAQDPELVTRAEILTSDYRRPTDDTGTSAVFTEQASRPDFQQFRGPPGEGISAQDLQTLDKAEKAAMDFAATRRVAGLRRPQLLWKNAPGGCHCQFPRRFGSLPSVRLCTRLAGSPAGNFQPPKHCPL